MIPVWVQFESGSTTASVKGNVSAGQFVDYVLAGQEGQTLVAMLTSPASDAFLSVAALDAGIPIVHIAAEAQQGSEMLPATDTYRGSVFASGAASSYTLEISLD